jgi:MFS family permease
VVLACSAVGYSSITAFSSLYARYVGMDNSGALYAVFSVTIIGVRLASLRTVDRHSRAAIAVPGLAIGAVGLALLATIHTPAAAFAGVGLFGVGFALVFPALMAFTVDRVSDRERGEVLGSFTAFMDIGTGAGGYLVGRVADSYGFGWAYALPAVLCAMASVLFWSLARRTTSAPAGDIEASTSLAAEIT